MKIPHPLLLALAAAGSNAAAAMYGPIGGASIVDADDAAALCAQHTPLILQPC